MATLNEYKIRLAVETDIPSVRRLVNEAYRELADDGLNYTASYQDEVTTGQRMQKGRCFLLLKELLSIIEPIFAIEFTRNRPFHSIADCSV